MAVATPASWRVTKGTVPFTDVTRTVREHGCTYASVDQAVRKGLITVKRQGGSGNVRHISVEDALLVLAVAAIASAAGFNFGALLRTVRQTGATVTADGLTIPLAAA